ncbi:MBL fold metallo-hydrolase [Flaviflagellibacter deserti]|uniref:MBL fold metallo-hydrolase n=1 Tax=Flaviflagellibacter deserti TaxID=2267266 RepID=A0ABV9Z6N5_9HYPH
MSLTVTILGCGSSGGVPRVATGWGACDPHEPRNRRRRCSILVRRENGHGETNFLVDTSPDLREQMLDNHVETIDGVLLTHDHADHTHGIDDLRPYFIRSRRRIDAWMDPVTSPDVRQRFGYIFETPDGSDYPPILNQHQTGPDRPFAVDGPGGSIHVTTFRLPHGQTQALGLRIGGMAYTPDLSDIPDDQKGHLSGLDLWIIDALRITPHPSHFSLSEALEWIERLKPKHAVLTNLHTDLDYMTLKRQVPPNVEPAYDGLVLEL